MILRELFDIQLKKSKANRPSECIFWLDLMFIGCFKIFSCQYELYMGEKHVTIFFMKRKKKYSFFFNNDNLSYEFYEKVSCGTIRQQKFIYLPTYIRKPRFYMVIADRFILREVETKRNNQLTKQRNMRVAATNEISQYGLKIFFYSFFVKIAQLL